MHVIIFSLLSLIVSCQSEEFVSQKNPLPDFMIGSFSDDYDITYSISDSLFSMGSTTIIHILEWDTEKQFFIGQNDSSNTYDPLQFSRIDWIELSEMESFTWAFCMSAYNAPSTDSARATTTTNPQSPKTGCNGYPYSRMKPISP